MNRNSSEIWTSQLRCGIGSRGPTGPIGPRGKDGIVGATGPDGFIGPSGIQGGVGPVGPPGFVGPTGVLGIIGPQGGVGPIGLTGFTGPTGVTGPAGPQGLQGAIGPIGNVGPIGSTGATGPIGAIGPLGPVGIVGGIGPTGPIGPIGSPGATGPTGGAGGVGLTGPIGPTGPNGPVGVAGGIGPTGAAGPIVPIQTFSSDAISVEKITSTISTSTASSNLGNWSANTPFFTNSNFNLTTGVYTVPATGVYRISCCISYSTNSVVANTDPRAVNPTFDFRVGTLVLVSTPVVFNYFTPSSVTYKGIISNGTSYMDTVVTLNAGEELRMTYQSGNPLLGINTSFTISPTIAGNATKSVMSVCRLR